MMFPTPAMLAAIPYSYVADQYGRRLVFSLTEVGLILGMGWILLVCITWHHLPIELIWVSAVSRLIGGGPSGAFAMLLTMAADSSSDETRSKTFYRLFSAMLLTELLGPPISYGAMQHSLWLPYLLPWKYHLRLSFTDLLQVSEKYLYIYSSPSLCCWLRRTHVHDVYYYSYRHSVSRPKGICYLGHS
ncbi:MAG: MFS transporter [Lasallia pustulata]|uniref:MFS transporter n=1 Tax=Lasallia pustulata TaxID=136370 RepID=A0A5M8PCE3_9LECA|nr:MAG: MFS transporter [Lasallia pustulata]